MLGFVAATVLIAAVNQRFRARMIRYLGKSAGGSSWIWRLDGMDSIEFMNEVRNTKYPTTWTRRWSSSSLRGRNLVLTVRSVRYIKPYKSVELLQGKERKERARNVLSTVLICSGLVAITSADRAADETLLTPPNGMDKWSSNHLGLIFDTYLQD
jgi:hypothetical protein